MRSEKLLTRKFGTTDSWALQIFRTGGASYLRTIEVGDNQGSSLAAILSPAGGVMGGRLTFTMPNSGESGAISTRVDSYFSEDIPVTTQRATPGADLASLSRGITVANRAASARQGMPRRLRAAVIENSLDVGDVELAPHLHLHSPSAREVQETGSFSGSLFGSGAPYALAAEEVGIRDDFSDTSHGTSVTLTIARGIVGLDIVLIPASTVSDRSPDHAVRLIKASIAEHHPSVVNVSMNFGGELENCDEVFGPVFREFSDTVLFVAGAGNDGAATARDVCPAGLAQKYSNVVSVAGVDKDGAISLYSNFGSADVTLAAPFCVDIASSDRHGGPGRQCGTSFSSAIVSNAALRYISDHPASSPAQVKAALSNACIVNGIDVASGGYLELSADDAHSP